MKLQASPYHDALTANLTELEEAEAYLLAVEEDYPEGYEKALRNVEEALKLISQAPGPADESAG